MPIMCVKSYIPISLNFICLSFFLKPTMTHNNTSSCQQSGSLGDESRAPISPRLVLFFLHDTAPQPRYIVLSLPSVRGAQRSFTPLANPNIAM